MSITARTVFSAGSCSAPAPKPIVSYEGSGTTDRRFLQADERGSIVAVSNGSGAVTNVNTYDEYGKPGPGNVGRFQYTGQKWIAALGLYDYKARMYHPSLRRFMQTDPIGYGDGMNMYAYARANPVNRADPSGTQTGDDEASIVCTCPSPPANHSIIGDHSFDWMGINGRAAGGMLEAMEFERLQLEELRKALSEGAASAENSLSHLSEGDQSSTQSPLLYASVTLPNGVYRLSFNQVSFVVHLFNRSTQPDNLIISLIFRESTFDYINQNDVTSMRGLMSVGFAALADVNRFTGSNISYDSLFDPGTNVFVGTTYLNHLLSRYGDLTVALDHYGTGVGSGYGSSVIGGKAVLDSNPRDPLAALKGYYGR